MKKIRWKLATTYALPSPLRWACYTPEGTHLGTVVEHEESYGAWTGNLRLGETHLGEFRSLGEAISAVEKKAESSI